MYDSCYVMLCYVGLHENKAGEMFAVSHAYYTI